MSLWCESSGTAAAKRYALRTAAFMTGYSAVNIAAIFGAIDNLPPPASYLFALVVAAPIIGQLWATLRLIEESDEFVRALLTKRVILASGAALAGASAWGLMESYADAPHMPAWLVYPLFWAVFGVITPFVRSSR